MRQLLNYLTESEYVDSLAEMREDEYHLFGLDDDGVVTVAGVTLRTDFYDGRHRFVYSRITREPRRPEDCGEAMIASLDEWARERALRVLPQNRGSSARTPIAFITGWTWSSFAIRSGRGLASRELSSRVSVSAGTLKIPAQIHALSSRPATSSVRSGSSVQKPLYPSASARATSARVAASPTNASAQ